MLAVPLGSTMTPQLPSRQGFDLTLRHCARELAAGLDEFGGSDPVGGLHKTRVALRRLTTCLDLFAPLLRTRATKDLRARAKACFHVTGLQREADVYLASWAQDEERDRLTKKADALRDKTRRRLKKSGAQDLPARIEKALDRNHLLGAGKPRRVQQDLPLERFAVQALRPVWQACARHGQELATLSAIDRHELRKRLKSLRYATEFLAPALRGPRVDDLLSELRQLQDLLGELNDLQQAQDRRRDLLVRDPALAAQSDRVLAEASDLWAAILAAGPAWPDADPDASGQVS